jgi:uncharacterized protein
MVLDKWIKRLLIRLIVSAVSVYILFGFMLFFNQRSMIYYPDNQNFDNCLGFYDYEKVTHNGTRFYFMNSSKERVIVHYHGNAGSACDRSYLRRFFELSNSSVIFVEYAGYSNDIRKPRRDLILQDVKNMNDFISINGFKDVIIYGESIGSGPASYHSYIGDVESIILVAPFSRMSDIAKLNYKFYPVSLLLREEYDNIYWLNDFDGNLIVFHGEHDSIVPAKLSFKLYETVSSENKEYILIEGKDHNDLLMSIQFSNRLTEFILRTTNGY